MLICIFSIFLNSVKILKCFFLTLRFLPLTYMLSLSWILFPAYIFNPTKSFCSLFSSVIFASCCSYTRLPPEPSSPSALPPGGESALFNLLPDFWIYIFHQATVSNNRSIYPVTYLISLPCFIGISNLSF